MITLGKEFYFEAAHFISGHPTCGQLHGHSWKLTVFVKGDERLLDSKGMLIDFHVLGNTVRKLTQRLDHKVINEELEQEFLVPITAETLAMWFWEKITSDLKAFPCTIGIRLQEGTNGGWAEYWEE